MRSRLRACFVLLGLGAACRGNPQVSFDVSLPSALVQDTVWFEIGAFRDTSCAALLPMLQGGVPDGAATRLAFRRDDKTTPAIGDLPRGTYAFAAVAKKDDCTVLATGCTSADVASTRSVTVSMNATAQPAGACGPGASCQAARCVPANDNADPSVGAGCSLELLGAGPLANSVGGGGTIVSAPAIAATPSGFIVVYREIDPGGSTTARITIMPIDPAGGALPPARPLLGGRCGGTDEFDGVGLLMNGGDGQLVVARPPCNGEAPGLELLNFSTKPEVTTEDKSHLVPSAGTQALLVSPSGVAATRSAGNVIAFTADGIARVSTVKPDGVSAPSGTFGATAGNTGAWATATDAVLALLAAGPSAPGAAPPPPTDAGAGDAGTSDAGTVDAGSADAGPTLRLLVLPVATALDQLVAPDQPQTPASFSGEWGALAARGSRVIVVSSGTGPGRSVSYRAFDSTDPTPVETNGFSVEGTAPVTTADVTIHGDRVFFAVLKQGLVALHVYDGASTTPRPLRRLDFTKEPRIPAIDQVRDGKIAIAATDSRVAVVWTTAKVLGNDDSTGGYAVFACTQ